MTALQNKTWRKKKVFLTHYGRMARGHYVALNDVFRGLRKLSVTKKKMMKKMMMTTTMTTRLIMMMLFFFNLAAQAQNKTRTARGVFYGVENLKVEQRLSKDRIPIESLHPLLSWEVHTTAAPEAPSQQVKAFQVLVGTKAAIKRTKIKSFYKKTSGTTDKNESLLWNSGKQQTGDLLHVDYKGAALGSDQTYYWCVRVWDGDNRVSQWSELDSFQTALLSRADWGPARWIGRSQMADRDRVLPGDTPEKNQPFGTDNDTLPLFRKEFALSGHRKDIKKATLYICGLGQFEARINGEKIGDHFLDPGWTNYQKEALYVSLDVTKRLKDGINALGVELGNGFYYIPGAKQWYKKLLVQYGYPKMICRLSIHYASGKVQSVVSDTSWLADRSSIQFSGIYGGELEDGRLRNEGWDQAGFTPAPDLWNNAMIVSDTPGALHLQKIDPIKIMDSFSPVHIYPVQNAERESWTYDMGQNCSGIPSMELNGKKGDTVSLLPAELMTADHKANQKATGKYRLIYILEKDGWQTWHPKFTYYGFRYIQVEGAVPVGEANGDHRPVIRKMRTLHLRNSAPEAGWFSCSNDLFNKTSDLIRWAMKSNMMSVFTDCPHREKLGWLEQVHLMGSSVRYNWQIRHLLKKSLADMRSAQTPEGLIPEIAPEFTVFTWGGDMFRDSPEWGSSAIIIPWYLYEWYGDSSELQKSYSMMTRYNGYLQGKAKRHILYQGLGDWYDLGPEPPGISQLTPKGLTATAIYYYDLQILEKTARLLGKQKDQLEFARQARAVREAFNKKFLHNDLDPSGKRQVYYGTGSQTADAMAVYMKLVPDSLHEQVVEHLVEGIVKGNYALTAGDIGYRYVLRVLEQEGYGEVIFKMNNRNDVPGYGFQLARGATALTESWQALSSVSNNHFMLGHLMEWFYSGILGIRLNLAPSAQNQLPLTIQPQMVGNLSWAKGEYQSPYGPVRVNWRKDQDVVKLQVHVPVGVKAMIKLPYAAGSELMADGQSVTNLVTERREQLYQVEAGSGDHHYTLQL